MANADCQACVVGVRILANGKGSQNEPIGSCKNCHSLTCGCHGHRDSKGEFICVQCDPSLLTASAVTQVQSGTSPNDEAGADAPMGMDEVLARARGLDYDADAPTDASRFDSANAPKQEDLLARLRAFYHGADAPPETWRVKDIEDFIKRRPGYDPERLRSAIEQFPDLTRLDEPGMALLSRFPEDAISLLKAAVVISESLRAPEYPIIEELRGVGLAREGSTDTMVLDEGEIQSA